MGRELGGSFKREGIYVYLWLFEAQVESRLPGEISITSDMQRTPPLWQKLKKN